MLVAGADANAVNVAAVLESPQRGGQLTHRLFRRKAGQKEPLSWLFVGISWWRKLRALVRRIHALSGDQGPVFWMNSDGSSAHFFTPQPLTMSLKIASSSLLMVTASVI
jgi:hypothetical protein